MTVPTPELLAARPQSVGNIRMSGAAPAIAPAIFTGLMRVGETLWLAALGYAVAALYVAEQDLIASWQYVVAPLATAFVAGSLFQMSGLYAVRALSSLRSSVWRLAGSWSGALVALMATLFFLKSGPDFSRVWLTVWGSVGFLTLLLIRLSVQSFARNAIAEGRFARRAVVYGTGPLAEAVIRALETDAASDVRICGVFDDRAFERTSGAVAGYPSLGGTTELVTFCRRHTVDMIIIALPLAAEARVERLMRAIRVLPADIRMAASASALKLSAHAYSYIGNVPMLDLSDRPLSDWGRIAKESLDKSIAAVALIALAPLMALIALAIKLESRGPVLFRQKRYGFNNQMIEVLKFRSMYTDRCDAAASALVTKNDPRVTRVGRFIRKTSLDELPQLINVLRGDLSLVGPRPHAAQARAADQLYPDVVADYFVRHKVKPGITGWAQINGWRGETDTPEKIRQRVAYDLYYIDNWSLSFDLTILMRTPLALLSHRENAY
jgi:Undecaprenyl-phosphate glucose phosphotransferase